MTSKVLTEGLPGALITLTGVALPDDVIGNARQSLFTWSLEGLNGP